MLVLVLAMVSGGVGIDIEFQQGRVEVGVG